MHLTPVLNPGQSRDSPANQIFRQPRHFTFRRVSLLAGCSARRRQLAIRRLIPRRRPRGRPARSAPVTAMNSGCRQKLLVRRSLLRRTLVSQLLPHRSRIRKGNGGQNRRILIPAPHTNQTSRTSLPLPLSPGGGISRDSLPLALSANSRRQFPVSTTALLLNEEGRALTERAAKTAAQAAQRVH